MTHVAATLKVGTDFGDVTLTVYGVNSATPGFACFEVYSRAHGGRLSHVYLTADQTRRVRDFLTTHYPLADGTLTAQEGSALLVPVEPVRVFDDCGCKVCSCQD